MRATIGGFALRSQYAFAFSTRRRRSPTGVLASALLHLLVGAILFLQIRESLERAIDAGRKGDGSQGGGGGGAGRVAYITLPAPASSAPKAVVVEPPKEAPAPVPVTPTPTPPPVVPPPVPEEQPVLAAATTQPADSVAGLGPGQGGGQGGSTGGGRGPGQGPGSGPGTGNSGGEGGLGRAPRPRFELIPPTDAPKEIRGREFRVLFAIDADGKVRKVTFEPELPRSKYANRLKEAMEGYRFFPALGPDGNPVAGNWDQTITF